ncbi:MAG: GNAT family N-acetyltransferase [Acidimicrobiia bacterium]|nr:GNAT family N-acetyltransferase [Acidimicrobiia bacterium]
MRVRGEWPNPIVIRRGWARAVARPWNSSRTDAHVRLERGSARFLAEAAEHVLGLGATAVISPPLMAGTRLVWKEAGFEPYTTLALLRRVLDGREGVAEALRTVTDTEWRRVVAIDAAAFGDTWKAELPALLEALTSASKSVILGIDDPATSALVGYAIVACSAETGYLQRIAVDPSFHRRGVARALTRAAHTWCLRRGARSVILNTKPDNEAALALYRSEGYTILPERLELLQYSGGRPE